MFWVAVVLGVIIFLYGAVQMLALQIRAGDKFYNLYVRKLLAKEYRKDDTKPNLPPRAKAALKIDGP